jgi:predicted ATP-binding protein involved in virulence
MGLSELDRKIYTDRLSKLEDKLSNTFWFNQEYYDLKAQIKELRRLLSTEKERINQRLKELYEDKERAIRENNTIALAIINLHIESLMNKKREMYEY